MNISISEEVRARCPEAALGILQYEAQVAPSSSALLELFEHTLRELSECHTLDSIAQIPHIAATRSAYKALGKSPHEYRNAAEAMLRRIVKSNGLYHINNVVEINNLISVSSGYSIGSYDVSQLQGDVILARAGEGVHYEGIGKASVNIEYLPTLCDALGPFGNPTSDSQRAMIQKGRRSILSVLYTFDGKGDLELWLDRFSQLLRQWCCVDTVETRIV